MITTFQNINIICKCFYEKMKSLTKASSSHQLSQLEKHYLDSLRGTMTKRHTQDADPDPDLSSSKVFVKKHKILPLQLTMYRWKISTAQCSQN